MSYLFDLLNWSVIYFYISTLKISNITIPIWTIHKIKFYPKFCFEQVNIPNFYWNVSFFFWSILVEIFFYLVIYRNLYFFCLLMYFPLYFIFICYWHVWIIFIFLISEVRSDGLDLSCLTPWWIRNCGFCPAVKVAQKNHWRQSLRIVPQKYAWPKMIINK